MRQTRSKLDLIGKQCTTRRNFIQASRKSTTPRRFLHTLLLSSARLDPVGFITRIIFIPKHQQIGAGEWKCGHFLRLTMTRCLRKHFTRDFIRTRKMNGQIFLRNFSFFTLNVTFSLDSNFTSDHYLINQLDFIKHPITDKSRQLFCLGFAIWLR